MKRKIYSLGIISFVIAISVYMPSISFVYAYSLSENSVLVLSGDVKEGKKVEINANITKNSGISAMLLELVYDTQVMTLTGLESGDALSTLDLITTNTKTEKGYSITPFKFSYLGKANDDGTGRLLKLNFALKDNIKDGKYEVSFRYNKNKDINYIDNDVVKTKNLTIDPVSIEIKGNEPLSIKTLKVGNGNLLLIIAGSIVGVSALVLLSIFFVSLYRKRGWKKI